MDVLKRKIVRDTTYGRELHFYTNQRLWLNAGGHLVYCTTYQDTLREIEQRRHNIATTQMVLLSTDFWDTYNLIIHDDTGVYKIKEGNNDCCKYQLRRNSNLFKMWQEGRIGYNYGRTRDSGEDA